MVQKRNWIPRNNPKYLWAHRYLGLFLGIQFLFWTISGLYFSWTDLDEIHGDHFKKIKIKKDFKDLISPSDLDYVNGIKSIELRDFRIFCFRAQKSELIARKMWILSENLVYLVSACLHCPIGLNKKPE